MHTSLPEGPGRSSRRFDQLLLAARAETELATRTQMYADAETYLIQDQMATIPLYGDGQLWVVQPWVQGLKVSPFDVFNFVDDATISKH